MYVLGLFEGFFALHDGFVELDKDGSALRILICRYRVGRNACRLEESRSLILDRGHGEQK